jgi:hypothetical protein
MNSRDRPAFDCSNPEWHKAHLKHGMISLQELYKSWHDSALDDLFDWRVFLLGEQLPEFCRGIQLARRVIREDTLNHLLRQLIREKNRSQNSDLAICGLWWGTRTHTWDTIESPAPGPYSSSESPPPEGSRFRLFEMFSSRFCFLISTC